MPVYPVEAPPELSATPLPVNVQLNPPAVEPLALPVIAPDVPLPPSPDPLPAVPLPVHVAFQSSWLNPLALVVPAVVDQSVPLLEPPDELLDHEPDADVLYVPVVA